MDYLGILHHAAMAAPAIYAVEQSLMSRSWLHRVEERCRTRWHRLGLHLATAYIAHVIWLAGYQALIH